MKCIQISYFGSLCCRNYIGFLIHCCSFFLLPQQKKNYNDDKVTLYYLLKVTLEVVQSLRKSSIVSRQETALNSTRNQFQEHSCQLPLLDCPASLCIWGDIQMLVMKKFSLGTVKVPWPRTHAAEQSHLQMFQEILMWKNK